MPSYGPAITPRCRRELPLLTSASPLLQGRPQMTLCSTSRTILGAKRTYGVTPLRKSTSPFPQQEECLAPRGESITQTSFRASWKKRSRCRLVVLLASLHCVTLFSSNYVFILVYTCSLHRKAKFLPTITLFKRKEPIV